MRGEIQDTCFHSENVGICDGKTGEEQRKTGVQKVNNKDTSSPEPGYLS